MYVRYAGCLACAALPDLADGGGGSGASSGQTIVRAGAQPSAFGPAANFTGRVRIDPVFPASPGIPASAGLVTFEPGARSAWHTHPAGQQLVVTAGFGRTQQWGGPIQELRPGDVVFCPPGVRHWHGASPTTAMTHLAITGSVNGRAVDWLALVSDAEYAGG